MKMFWLHIFVGLILFLAGIGFSQLVLTPIAVPVEESSMIVAVPADNMPQAQKADCKCGKEMAKNCNCAGCGKMQMPK